MKLIILILVGLIVFLVAFTFWYFFQRSQGNSSNFFLKEEFRRLPKIMEIKSPAFKNNGNIPSKYTCDGEDVNPPLKIGKVPLKAKSLVLIVEDPDAPGRSFLHWLLWNIPPETKEIQENNVPERAVQGITDFGKKGWGGPCPPKNVGLHHYFFRLYALDRVLDIVPSASFTEVKEAMEGHILDKAELVGIYKR